MIGHPVAPACIAGGDSVRPVTRPSCVLNLLPHLVNGITLGLLFALIALGFMLILGLMEQINLAHGSLFALGAYFAYAIATPRLPLPPDMLQAWAGVPLGWRFAAALLLAPILVAPFGAGARAPDAAHLRPRSALRPAAHLRRRHGARGADPHGLGHARLHAAGAARACRAASSCST